MLCWYHCDLPWRTSSEGIWFRFWDFTFYCYQYLVSNHLNLVLVLNVLLIPCWCNVHWLNHSLFWFTVRTSSGRHLAQPPSMLDVELSLKVLSLPCSTFLLPGPTKFVPFERHFIGKTFQTSPTCLQLSWSSSLLSISKVSVLFCL